MCSLTVPFSIEKQFIRRKLWKRTTLLLQCMTFHITFRRDIRRTNCSLSSVDDSHMADMWSTCHYSPTDTQRCTQAQMYWRWCWWCWWSAYPPHLPSHHTLQCDWWLMRLQRLQHLLCCSICFSHCGEGLCREQVKTNQSVSFNMLSSLLNYCNWPKTIPSIKCLCVDLINKSTMSI